MADKRLNSAQIKKINRNRIFRYLCQRQEVSNPEIAYELKMSLPTVMQYTKDLIEQGLVVEQGEFQSTGGRKAKAIAAAVNSRMTVGLDITKNHISLVLCNLAGEIVKYIRIFKPFIYEAAYFQEVGSEIEKFLRESNISDEQILGLGISVPGIVEQDIQMITSSYVLGIYQIPFDQISQYFPYACTFINDANAGAYAECQNLAEEDRIFYLSLSNSVGGAVCDQEQFLTGERGRCGEIGHMTIEPEGKTCYCGKKGCLDCYLSAQILTQNTDGNLEQFFIELGNQNPKFQEIWETYLEYLAIGVNNVRMILDCRVIIGGYVGSYMEDYMGALKLKLSQRNTFEKSGDYVSACKYKIEAAALGAAMLVRESFLRSV